MFVILVGISVNPNSVFSSIRNSYACAVIRSFFAERVSDNGSSGWFANPQYSAEANYDTAQCASPACMQCL